MRGKFITFEGPDGSGKTTQMAKVHKALLERGYQVVMTREPGGTKISEAIRNILLNPENLLTDRTEALLYAAARAQHVEELIIPALEEGKVVLCDRFIDSTLAYQGYGRGISLDLLRTVNRLAVESLEVDLTIILDLNPDVGLRRIREKRLTSSGGVEDRIEREQIDFHERVRRGFLELALQNPKRYKVVSALDDEDTVFSKVMNRIVEVLK